MSDVVSILDGRERRAPCTTHVLSGDESSRYPSHSSAKNAFQVLLLLLAVDDERLSRERHCRRRCSPGPTSSS